MLHNEHWPCFWEKIVHTLKLHKIILRRDSEIKATSSFLKRWWKQEHLFELIKDKFKEVLINIVFN